MIKLNQNSIIEETSNVDKQNNETNNQFRKRTMLIEKPSVILNSLRLNSNYKDIKPTIE